MTTLLTIALILSLAGWVRERQASRARERRAYERGRHEESVARALEERCR